MSLIKGVDNGPEGLKLISDTIRAGLCGAVPVSVLMGANVANEVARDELCESTVRATVVLLCHEFIATVLRGKGRGRGGSHILHD